MQRRIRLAWRREGGGDCDELIVFRHGLTGKMTGVRRYAPAITGTSRLFLDLPGHGDSPAIDDFTPSAVSDCVADLLTTHTDPATRVHVVGVSLGAVVARELARRSNLGIASTVLIRPAHTHAPRPAHLALNLVVADLLDEDSHRAAARLVSVPAFQEMRSVSPGAAKNLLDKAQAADPEHARRRAALLRAGSGWTVSEAPAQPVPTLVIAASGDGLHPERIATEWARELPGAGLARVVAPDHPGHDEEVRSLLREHLENRGG
jgi:pimeloyl-ACP methyl ester carboxylesterase